MDFEQKSAIEKAIDRAKALGDDLERLKVSARESRPDELNSDQQKRQRRDFLLSLYGNAREGMQAFERVLQGNELQDASFLWRGALAARAVVRLVLKQSGGGIAGYGTGFLIGDGVVITNNHVLPSADVAALAEAQSQYERDENGIDLEPESFAILPGELFFTSVDLDFTIAAVARTARSGSAMLGALGWLPLLGMLGKVSDGEWLTIVQHPKGERKQVCVRENQLLKREADLLWYSTDTEPGSSGSPVFNNDWLVVALHHSGVPKIVDGKWQTVDGRDYDESRDSEDRIEWVANEGIRVSRIVDTLRDDPAMAAHPLVRPILDSQVVSLHDRLPVLYPEGFAPPAMDKRTTIIAPKEDGMPVRRITLTLEIDDMGNARVVGPGGGEAAALGALAEAKAKLEEVDSPARPREDWVSGFDTEFLGKGESELRVNLPKVTSGKVAPLIDRDGVRCDGELAAYRAKQNYLKRTDAYGHEMNPEAAEAGILHYNNFSLVMNPDRRLAHYVAANIDGGVAWSLGRPEVSWLLDERILPVHQLNDSFYRGTLLDRGHLCRREDLEWGTDKFDATRRANGTFVHTNCSPQFWKFNRQQGETDKGLLLWQGLETFILEKIARIGQFKLQVISGPLFGEFDREFRGVKIPFDFWKVVVGLNEEGKLFATSFVLSQKEFVDDGSLIRPKEAVSIEDMFAKFEIYQRPIEEIEQKTGLKFTYGSGARPKRLALVDRFGDELKKPAWQRRRSRKRLDGGLESFGAGAQVSLGGPLTDLDDIVI